jgi:hypothetical protein
MGVRAEGYGEYTVARGTEGSPGRADFRPDTGELIQASYDTAVVTRRAPRWGRPYAGGPTPYAGPYECFCL